MSSWKGSQVSAVSSHFIPQLTVNGRVFKRCLKTLNHNPSVLKATSQHKETRRSKCTRRDIRKGSEMAAPYDPQIAQWFAAVDVDRSGKITAQELQSALMSSNGRQFSETACRLMIGLFDQSGSGSIDITGFTHLYGYVNQWLESFRRYDQNGSGFVDQNELMQAFTTMGYRFTQQFVNIMHQKFSESGQGVPVDGFIMACILIHKLTDGFRKRDTAQQGVITISYEDFLSTVLQAWV